jgi:hypothetical protein
MFDVHQLHEHHSGSGSLQAETALAAEASFLLIQKWNLARVGSQVLQTHINFPRFLPIFPDFLEQLSHLAPIY